MIRYYETASGVVVVSYDEPYEADGKMKTECWNVRADGSIGGYHGLLKMRGLKPTRRRKARATR